MYECRFTHLFLPLQSLLSVRQRLWFIHRLVSKGATQLEPPLFVEIWKSLRHWAQAREVFWYWLRMMTIANYTLGDLPLEVRGRVLFAWPRACRDAMRTLSG